MENLPHRRIFAEDSERISLCFRLDVLVFLASRYVDVYGSVLQRNPGPFSTMSRRYQ